MCFDFYIKEFLNVIYKSSKRGEQLRAWTLFTSTVERQTSLLRVEILTYTASHTCCTPTISVMLCFWPNVTSWPSNNYPRLCQPLLTSNWHRSDDVMDLCTQTLVLLTSRNPNPNVVVSKSNSLFSHSPAHLLSLSLSLSLPLPPSSLALLFLFTTPLSLLPVCLEA